MIRQVKGEEDGGNRKSCRRKREVAKKELDERVD